MAKIAAAAGTGNQVVGKVFILYGTVKAVSPDGTVRVLAPNNPIYADERIITDSDGSVSIQFDGPPVTQLDLGRMTEIVIDQDVYAGVTPEAVSDAAAQAEQVQQSLLSGDQPIDLEATAAGGATGAGGGHPVVNFALDGSEVTPGSGADTTGVTSTPVDPISGVFVEAAAPEPAPVAPVAPIVTPVTIAAAPIPDVTPTPPPPSPPDYTPTAGEVKAGVDDEGQHHGIPGGAGDVPGEMKTATGTLTHDFGGDGPGSIGFAAMDHTTGLVGTETVTYSWDAITHTLTAEGPRGDLFTVHVTDTTTGAYTLTMLDNVLHDPPATASENDGGHIPQAYENDATVPLTYTVTDGNGTTATGTLTITINDDIPFCLTAPDIALVEDEKMPGGNDEHFLWVDGTDHVTGTIVNNVLWGADGFGKATTFSVGEENFTINTDGGTKVYWAQDGTFLGTNTESEGAPNGGQTTDFLEVISDGPTVAASLLVNSDGTYTYQLLDNMLLGQGHQGEQIDLLDKVTITGEDGDGDAAAVNVYLNVQDDIPEVSISNTPTKVVEGQTISGTWSHADGADGAVTAVIVNGQTYAIGDNIDTGKGTLVVSDGTDGTHGTWTFTAVNNLDNDYSQSIKFTVKATDGDGDIATDSQTIKITDGEGPHVGEGVSLTVEESALAAGTYHGTGTHHGSGADIDNTGNNLHFTAGSDDISSFVFGNTSSISISGLDLPGSVTWTPSNGGQTLTGSVGGVDAIQLVLGGDTTVEAGATGNVTVTATLLDNFVNQDSPNASSLSITGINVVGADHDGDSVSGHVSVTVADDAPVSTGAENVVIANASGEPIPQVTDLIVTLDTSGSMAGAKLESGIEAMKALIHQYDENGGVHVQFTTFGTNSGPSTAWMTETQAQTFLDNLHVFTGDAQYTNYEAAIQHTILGDGPDADLLTDTRPAADQTVAYFVTDGEPNHEYKGDFGGSQDVISVSGAAVDPGYVAAWHTFIHDTVDNLFVVAVQTSVTDPDLVNLSVAGQTTIINVTDTGDLVHQLAETVVVGPPETVSATASLGVNIGTDGWGTAQISDAPTMDDHSALHYVTGVAANGDSLIVTSDGVKLVYEDDGLGGLKAVKEGTNDVVFTVSLNTGTASYTVTMLGHVDAYTVENPVVHDLDTDTSSHSVSGADVVVHETDSLTFVGSDNIGGGNDDVLNIAKTDSDTGIKFDIKATGDDHIYGNTSGDHVNWSSQGIGVGNNFIDNPDNHPSETLKLEISATAPAGGDVSNIHVTGIAATLDHLGTSETASWDVAGKTGAPYDGSTVGVNNAGGDASHDVPITIGEVPATTGDPAISTVTFSAADGDNYRVDIDQGMTVHYTYDESFDTTVTTKTTVTTETTTTSETAYDVTLAYQFTATDGDGDQVQTVFHVTVDANNDGVLNAVSSDETVGVTTSTEDIVTTTTTTTTTTYVDDGKTIPVGDPVVVTVVDPDSSTHTDATVIDTDDLQSALNHAVDSVDNAAFTNNDVIVGGSGNETLSGGAGDDTISGGAGDDTIHGNDGNDIITGGAGKDSLFGDAGTDTIDAKDATADTIIDGGTGADIITYDASLDISALVPDPEDTTHT